MRYWCISTSDKNWKICKAHNVWGMDSRYFVTLEKFLKEGDKAAVYTHGGKFVALIEFVGEYFYCEKELGWDRLYPYRIKLK